MKTCKIRVKDNTLLPYLKEKIFATRHFENILLILIRQDYEQQNKKFFDYLTNEKVMRAVITGNVGGEVKEKVNFVREHYKNNQLMNDLIEVGKTLKIHNIVETIKTVKSHYKGFFTKVKNGDMEARPPKPKKLSKLIHYTVKMDSCKSFTLAKKNRIGLNLSNKMRYTRLPHEALFKIVGNLQNIHNVEINLSNGQVYLLMKFEREADTVCEDLLSKLAGLDIGVNNLATVYVEDDDTPSFIVDGSRYKKYNSSFNRFLAELNETIARTKDKAKQNYLKKYRSFLYEKRNNFFFSEFHKIAKRTLEYLQKHKVTHFVVSSSLADLKTNGELEMRKDVKQSFVQIPFMQFIQNIKEKAPRYGITIIDVNEAYTSKTSSLSANVKDIHTLAFSGQSVSTNDFKGSRVKRGLYKDRVFKIFINADVNGAKNITFLGSNLTEPTVPQLNKLCNPIKIKSDNDFCKLLQNSAIG